MTNACVNLHCSTKKTNDKFETSSQTHCAMVNFMLINSYVLYVILVSLSPIVCILLLNTPYLFQYVVPPGPTRFIAPVCNNEGNCLLFRIYCLDAVKCSSR